MDPDAIENTLSHEQNTSEGPKNAIHDEKTDELVTSIESGVDKAYSSIQDTTLTGLTKIQGWVNEKFPELQKQLGDVKLPELPKVNVDVNELKKKINLDEYIKKEDIENLKLKSGEFISKAGENTNKVLDDIDSDLEKLENLTIDYAKQIGDQVGSFFKSKLGQLDTAASETKSTELSTWGWSSWGKQLTELVVGDSPENVLANENKTELIFRLPDNILVGSRAEVEIKELQSKESVYFDAVQSGEFKDYQITDEQRKEIEELLHNEALHLMSVYKKIVNDETTEDSNPKQSISSEDFWKVYFGKREKIIEAEKKRKALLEKSAAAKDSNADDDEEDFNWD
ncbi:hypothetical protein CANINC_002732 [Pichia inconspicua]|uniref:BSD domain-containing protein n=1 Tax=Pichia inconspicua TaxID=52247 RepID=A0A4T0X0H8_9ASCO|nr:hypothetical protein CANINC_002732 [[Candida] inconspicua]